MDLLGIVKAAQVSSLKEIHSKAFKAMVVNSSSVVAPHPPESTDHRGQLCCPGVFPQGTLGVRTLCIMFRV